MELSKEQRKRLRSDVERLHAQDAAYQRASTAEAVRLFVFLLLVVAFLRMFVFDIILVKGPSMEPTLIGGERVFAQKITYLFSEPARGDVVIAHYPPEIEKESVVKRVIALPGESVRISDGVIYIDDVPLDESAYWQGYVYGEMPTVHVPQGYYFLVGDNRNMSSDSRDKFIGPVPRERIHSKVHFRVWPIGRAGKLLG